MLARRNPGQTALSHYSYPGDNTENIYCCNSIVGLNLVMEALYFIIIAACHTVKRGILLCLFESASANLMILFFKVLGTKSKTRRLRSDLRNLIQESYERN